MGITSLQVCMDSVDWFQGTINEETEMDSSSPSADMLGCARPLIERRLRPPHDQALKCPRCESTHTKFCYYNNYSLSQPRYFCKTCRRYWTKGGTLRNIPVGGGCRKNKKVSNKNNIPNDQSAASDVQLSHLNGITNNPTSYMDGKYGVGLLQENPSRAAVDFMDNKWNSYDFMVNGGHFQDNHQHHQLGMIDGIGGEHHNQMISTHHGLDPNLHGNFGSLIQTPSTMRDTHQSPYRMMSSFEAGSSGGASGTNLMETYQRLMLPYPENDNMYDDPNGIDVKPNPNKLLSLEWHDQGYSVGGNKDTFGNNYANSLGPSWAGIINNYGPSTTNPLV